MLSVNRPYETRSGRDDWIGPAPWIVSPPPGPETQWAISRQEHANTPPVDRPYPLVIRRAQGTIVEDLDGNRYLDFSAGSGVSSAGHCHPRVLQAVEEQTHRLMHVGGRNLVHEPMIQLAEKLNQLAPGDTGRRTMLSNHPNELIEAAATLARRHTGRKNIIFFQGSSYTGCSRTLTTLPEMRAELRKRLGSPLKEVRFDDVNALDELVEKGVVDPAEVAAVMVQPVLSEGHCVIPSPDYLVSLRQFCNRFGILMIDDECHIGVGRTGKLFCCENFGVVPDMIMVNRGLGSGLPIGALITDEALMETPEQMRGLNWQADSISCAAALATLSVLEEHLLDNASKVAAVAMKKLQHLAAEYRCFDDPKGLGLMLRIGVSRGRGHSSRSTELRDRIIYEAFSRGLLVGRCGDVGIRMEPPLSINQVQIEVGFDVLEEAVATVVA